MNEAILQPVAEQPPLLREPADQPPPVLHEPADQPPSTDQPALCAPADAPPATLHESAAEPPPALREQAHGLLARLIEVYPAAFFPLSERQIRPLKLGIHKELAGIVKDWGYDRVVLRYTLGSYTRRLRYQLALLNSPHRVDLAGDPAGEITAEHRQIAQDKVALIREKRKQQSRQATPSGPAVASEPSAADLTKPPEPTVSTTPPLAASADSDDPTSPASRASATHPATRSHLAKPARQSSARSQPPARPQPSGRRYRDNSPPRPVPPAVPPAAPPVATAPSRTSGGISAEAIAALQQKLSTKARL